MRTQILNTYIIFYIIQNTFLNICKIQIRASLHKQQKLLIYLAKQTEKKYECVNMYT